MTDIKRRLPVSQAPFTWKDAELIAVFAAVGAIADALVNREGWHESTA